MKRIHKPFEYINAELTKTPGYLAKRMKLYRQQVEDEKRKREENVTQLKPKIKVKP